MLTVEQTAILLKQAKEETGLTSDTAKATLIERNSPLIKSIVKRYIGKGVDYDDLYQLGCLGFIKAINKYDSRYGVKFTTYAVPLIAGEVKRFLRDDGTIKVSRSVKTLYTHIKRFLATCQGMEHSPTIDEIATQLDVSREDVVYAMEAAQMPVSLFDKSDTGEGERLSIAERLPAPITTDPVDRIMLKNMLEQLDMRDRKVIILRYFRNQTQSQIAKALGISQVQVSRIEQRVLSQFREHLAEAN